MRVRQIAGMNRQFRSSYEKYGIGRGIESSNSSGSANSKSDPYGSFFEVETEKPRKTRLHFKRASSSTTSHGPPPTKPMMSPGWVASSTFAPPSMHVGPKKTPAAPVSGWNQGAAYPQKPPTSAQGPASPPGLKVGSSRRSSFAFPLRKSEDRRPPKVQHLATSTIKSKGISAPMIVANGGAEPWSPLPTPDPPSINVIVAPPAPNPPPLGPLPQLPAPVASQRPKLKQPQPRSPPATPGTSQKLKHDMLSPSNYVPKVFSGNSDGSLYSRNSFSSSNHDQSHPQLPEPTPVTDLAASVPTSMSPTSGGGRTSRQSMNTSPQERSKPGKSHNPHPSSSYTYSPQQAGEIVRPESAGSQYPGGSVDNLPRLMTVVAPFTPTLEDELPLKVGDTVRVIEEYRDGWCLVQLVGRIDSPRGVVPCVCLQERKRIVPVPVNVGGPILHSKHSDTSHSTSSHRR